jgi:FkbM family methyltransferase
MYASRKSKHVYVVEADKQSFEYLKFNLQNNCKNNYTLINKAIYHIDNTHVKFGKNKFEKSSKMNDSTSQIYNDNDEESNEYYHIETITLHKMVDYYHIDLTKIGLIKIDIEGGEENILEDCIDFCKKHKITVYISFHYSWWNNKNIHRFHCLTNEQKNFILNSPFGSLLFCFL